MNSLNIRRFHDWLGTATTELAQSALNQVQGIAVASGVGALLLIALFPEGAVADRFALTALIAFSVGTTITWLQLLPRRERSLVASGGVDRWRSRAWLFTAIGLALAAGLAVQTWFKPGTSIAGGDIPPPEGTAWLGRLFDPWIWSGSSLGEPSQLQMELPWATVLGIVHGLGADPAAAQRIWYTLLFVGAAMSGFALIAALRMGPVAAVVGAAVYVLNPYVVSEVNTYAVFMVAVCLLAAMPAALVAVGSGRLPVVWGVALLVLASPLLGYVFFNPPLVGLVLGASLATPLLVAWVDGKEAGLRSFRALLLAVPLLLATSTYWIVPAILHLSDFSGSQLVSLSTWTWTEARANIRNAFWLNAIWGWTTPAYYPYAPAYDRLVLKIAEFAMPAIAFSALGLRALGGPNGRIQSRRELRLAVAASTVALIVIFLSTGTNPPGNIVFDPLYSLPFGWLFREPGRFLMLVGLMYALLSASLVQALLNRQWVLAFIRARRPSVEMLRFAIVPLSLAMSLVVGFPLYTGAVVPDARPDLPPAHVKVPAYWTQMGQYVDGLPGQGGLLVMPPDDFYQMPYKWGYYGTDSFVVHLFRRPVLVPNGQGYSPASSQFMQAVNMTASSIIQRDWRQVETLVRALNAPLILVRRDVDPSFLGRSMVPPNALSAALNTAPNFVLVRQIGSLDLFSLVGATSDVVIGANFATINVQTPDLRILAVAPPNQALASSESQPGVPNIVQAPPVELWNAQEQALLWQPISPPGWTYRIADLSTKKVVPLDPSGTVHADLSPAVVEYLPAATSDVVTVSVQAETLISNGDFAKGTWGPVGDCRYVNPDQAQLSAKVIPSGAPGGLQAALRLSASIDAACENQPLTWRRGPLVVSLMVHPVRGSGPRICLWEFGLDRCASLPAIAEKAGWSTYHASVTPDSGTTSISLYLYADGGAAGSETVNEYANVHVVGVPALPDLALLSDPPPGQASRVQLALDHSSFSNLWQGSVSGRHVVVDGMLNGWLISSGVHKFSGIYTPANTFWAAQWISLVTALLIVLFAAGPMVVKRTRRR